MQRGKLIKKKKKKVARRAVFISAPVIPAPPYHLPTSPRETSPANYSRTIGTGTSERNCLLCSVHSAFSFHSADDGKKKTPGEFPPARAWKKLLLSPLFSCPRKGERRSSRGCCEVVECAECKLAAIFAWFYPFIHEGARGLRVGSRARGLEVRETNVRAVRMFGFHSESSFWIREACFWSGNCLNWNC